MVAEHGERAPQFLSLLNMAQMGADCQKHVERTRDLEKR